MGRHGTGGQALKDWFLAAVDRDTEAFNAVIAASRLPKKTPEDAARRAEALEAASQGAALVPLEVLEATIGAFELARAVAAEGNPNSVSDAGVAGACALAAAEGASLNVRINLPTLTDRAVASAFETRREQALERARALAENVKEAVETVLGAPARTG
jgi:glutamate formiminotransferase/formiminotetrahydrofolate cyclodeaminase